jgi:excisionase family DNA binding protein
MTSFPQLLKADQAADLLTVSTDQLYVLVRDHDLPCVRMGTRVMRFRPEALIAWVEEGGVQAHPKQPKPPTKLRKPKHKPDQDQPRWDDWMSKGDEAA